MANRDDDPGAPKPLFVPPKLAGPPSRTPAPDAGAPSAFSSKPPVTPPAFGEWPDVPVRAAAEDTHPIERAKPSAPEPAPVPASAASKPASASASGLRAPVHARKTSTQAHSIVGEFGVPPPADSKPSTPIVDEDDDSEDDESESDDSESRDELPRPRPRPVATPVTAADEDPDDPERTDEDPKPIEPPTIRDTPSKRSPLPLVIGLSLAAALVIAIVVGMQDSGSKPGNDASKPNRGDDAELAQVDVPTRETKPRPPGDTRTKLGDPPPANGSESDGSDGSNGSDTDTGTIAEPAETDTGNEVDPRDPSVIPPGTPEENVKAFMKLPVSIHDGRPLGGIGRTGIHVDAITTGREYRSGECKDRVETFSATTDKEVSVCFRIVHDREEESVRVLWDKDGVTTRRGGVRIRDLHAYKTRAYLELRPEYVGNWRVRVISEDDVELAAFEFEIAK